MRARVSTLVVTLSLFGSAGVACSSKGDGEHPRSSGAAGATAGASSRGSGNGGTPASGGQAPSGDSGRPSMGESGSKGTQGGANTAGQGDSAGGGSGGAVSGGGHATGGSGGGAVGGSGTGPGGGAPATGGAEAGGAAGDPGTPGCSPNDEFEGTALDACWQVLNGSAAMPLIEIAESDGALHLGAQGDQNGVWYQGATKSLVYQRATAPRFTLTTLAHPRKATDSTSLPTKDLHVGGVMVRDPSSNGGNTENYVFLMVGHSENNNGMVHQGVEFKSTIDGCSDWLEPDWGAAHDEPDAELRICRLGAEFRMFKRVPGDATWTAADPPSGNCSGNAVSGSVLTRSDLPDTVEVGLALNFNAPSDLAVAFDFVHFVVLPPSATADDCTRD